MSLNLSHLPTGSPLARRRELPELEGLEEPRGLLHESICLLEEICCGTRSEEPEWLKIDFTPDQNAKHVRDELLALVRSLAHSAYFEK
jgi:hypothetical protein